MGTRGSSEEGEIPENGGGDLKATTLPNSHGKGVDRQNRNRGRYSRSPGSDRSHPHGNRDTSPRGFKRSRDDRDSNQHRGRGTGGDPRNFRVHYEDPRDDRRIRQYDDLDRPTSRGSSARHGDQGGQRGYNRHDNRDRRYDDRDRGRGYPDKRPRTRSRSPLPGRGRGRRDRGRKDYPGPERRMNREQAESIQYNTHHDSRPRDELPKRGPAAEQRNAPKDFAKSAQGVAVENGHVGSTLVTRERTDPPPPPEQDYEEEERDVEAEIERRRRRREEILRKSRASTPMHLLALADKTAVSTPGNSTQPPTPHHTDANTPRSSAASPAMSPAPGQEGLTPEVMDLANDQDLSNARGDQKAANDEDGPSAAEYDPTADMQEDERRDERRHGTVGFHGEEREPKAASGPEQPAAEKASDETADDDDFDMFAEEIDEEKYVAPKAASTAAAAKDQARNSLAPPAGGILEGDDKEGYYKIRPGEVVNGRYQIQSSLGKGMFSGVVRGLDINTKELVAIKIMRTNDALKKGGLTEIAILQKLNAADPDNKKHIVRFERSFEHLGHLCMAFENLSMNLREVLKKFGNNVGIKLSAVRIYAYQIFVALAHMRKCTIIHADLKPDNILVNEARNHLKICDLGTAIDRSDAATAHNEITPYLVSRFYRAPEIILGIPYDYAADMWSIGCTLYELYTGKILFTGGSNNQMLKAMMEIRGKMSPKLYRRGELWRLHFDEMGSFISQERDDILGKPTIRVMPVIKPTRDLRTRLLGASSGMGEDETRELHLFYDLLDKCLNLNPEKRLPPADALKHPFFTAKGHSSTAKGHISSKR